MEEEEIDSSGRIIILASSSPRRKRILEQLMADFIVIEPDGVDEKLFGNPYKTVKYNSNVKAKYIYNNVIIKNSGYRSSVIAGFDTIVYLRGRFLGKPSGYDEAFEFIRMLSGRVHNVITGVTVIDSLSGKIFTDSEATSVKMRRLGDDEIKSYLEAGDVYDKAGGYDISGFGSILIEQIKGCFYNVAGLPVFKFIKLLKNINYEIL